LQLACAATIDRCRVLPWQEIMRINLQCVRPCYPDGASGDDDAVIWHDESVPACRNIYFTPLVHSMYALHLRRWLRVFPASSMLLLRFDDLVLQPLQVLQGVCAFLHTPPLDPHFKVEVGRKNFTTLPRLLESNTTRRETVHALQTFFEPHNAALHRMFPGRPFW
jgi:hypothetical protein